MERDELVFRHSGAHGRIALVALDHFFTAVKGLLR
jgi:hypothetical protein